jgi:hypothetical protein
MELRWSLSPAVLPVGVLVVRQLGEVPQGEGLSRHRMLLVLLHVGHDVHEVEDGAVGRADRVVKGSEGHGAAVKGEARKRRVELVLGAAPLLAPVGGCEESMCN